MDNIQKKIAKFNEITDQLQKGVDNGWSLRDTSAFFDVNKDYFYDYIYRGAAKTLFKNHLITKEQWDTIQRLYYMLRTNKDKKLRFKFENIFKKSAFEDISRGTSCSNNNLEDELMGIDEELREDIDDELDEDLDKDLKKVIDDKEIDWTFFKTKCYDDSNDNSDDESTKTWANIVHDENGDVLIYEYGFPDRWGGKQISGYISKGDMEKIYNLYTKEGANLTQRSVSREFLEKLGVDFVGFKKILRLFNITKDSIPVSPHTLAEQSTEQVFDKVIQMKEKLLFKKIDLEKCRVIEQKYLEVLKENCDLKNNLKDVKKLISDINWNEIEPYWSYPSEDNIVESENALVVILSDIHIGAMVEDYELYENEYNFNEVEERFKKIYRKIWKLRYDLGNRQFDRIIVVNLGDALDGFDQSTIRHKHHQLPQNMSNKKQFESYIKIIKTFIDKLWDTNLTSCVDFYSVPEGNHDGVNGYMANRLLEEYFKVKYPNMVAKTFDKFIDWIKYKDHILLFTHGKDANHMGKGYPLFLNSEIENKINEYIDTYVPHNNQKDNIMLIKGDLHQSGVSYGRKFTYKSVGSIFGSSGWSAVNFGSAKPVCEMLVLGNDKNDVIETKVFLK
jgi:hypothetical protein